MADNDKNGTRENNDGSGDSAEKHDSPEETNSQEGDNDEETPRRKQVPQSDTSRTSQDSSRTTKAKSTADKERKRRKQVPQSDKSSASQDPSRTTKAKSTAEKMQKSDDKPRHTNYTLWHLGSIVLVTVLAIAVGRATVLYMYPSDDDVSERANPNFDFAKIYELGLQRLEGRFKKQTPRFWKTLRNRGLAHLKRVQPTQPLVLMLGAPPSAHTWVSCFVKKLAKILDPEHENGLTVINGKDYISSVGDKAKEELDNTLKETLQSGHRAAVVCDLQLLPPPSPVLFHSYCDNDNAPYKHVAILFTVRLPHEPDPALDPVRREGLVEEFLSQVWSDERGYNIDAVSALLSRIADTVVVLNGEEEQDIETVCGSNV